MTFDKGIRVINFKELRSLNVTKMKPRPQVVFVNRRQAFKPPDGIIDAEDFEKQYLREITSRRRAMRELREIAYKSRCQPVLLVKDRVESQEPEILARMIETFKEAKVW